MKVITLVGGCLCLALPVFCQSEDLSAVFSRFDRNCQRPSTASYRSRELVQPRSGVVFFVTGELQRRPRQDSQLINSNCFPVKPETPRVVLSFLTPRVNSIPLFRHRSTFSFNYIKPVAFSPDGRFLLLQIDSSNGVDLQSEVEVIDTKRGFLPLNLDICPEAIFGETFIGFIGNNQAQFRCLAGTENDREVWHLERRSGRQE